MNYRIAIISIIAGSFLFLSAGLVLRPLPAIIPDLENKIEDYYRKYPQQKVYLHLNKDAYQAGDEIWYRADLLDARTHRPDTISKNLVVEILNSYGHLSMIQLLKMENGNASGTFHLPDTLREGLYQIRAYTNWMRNFGSEYYFRRNFNVWNPGNYLNLYREDKLASKKHKKKSSRKAGKINVSFFPEGGYMIGGQSSRVGFKAINELGLGVDVEGEILDKKGRSIASINSTHRGMGAFLFTPEKGQSYTAEINLPGDRKQRFKLPEVMENGYQLQVLHNRPNELRLQIRSSGGSSDILMVCHVRGKLLWSDEISVGTVSKSIDISTGDFPGGILHITLFDNQRKPRCERLVYVHNDEYLRLSLSQEKQEYERMEAVEITLEAMDNNGKPVEGSFSLSVSDRDLPNNAGEFQSGIISHCMLASDIAGIIEQPDYYFSKQDAETRENLDLLLLTQGWRRFSWDDIINENYIPVEYPIQKGLLVIGRITRELFNRPLKNVPVTLTVLSEFNDVFITRTDDRGEYEFELPDYEDTIQVEITARRLNGRKNLVIYIDENDLEETETIFSSYASEMTVLGTNTMKPREEREPDSNQIRTEGIYKEADYVLYVDESMNSYSSVLALMQGRIPGVTVAGNSVQIRGPSSFYASNEPLYLLDNVPTDAGTIQALSVADVERIEVLKGPSAAIYGVRGANGVIAVFTKRGRFMKKGVLTFDMLGYHKPQEFYSPVYGTDFDDLVTDTRSSLYWNPRVITDSTGMAVIRFYNSKKATKFYVMAEGLSQEGLLGKTERTYLVR